MEHLGYLRKLYEYGETLSADELNEIVLYINTSIETINILIDREYAINNGHCEVRYKNSAQLPTKPATGSSGYSDGWSATYTVPDTEHGEITWMSICFLNGNGEYGVWSSPVRITWGTTSGGGSGEGSGQGRDGDPGAFKSRVFKRQNTKPARPVGGSYTVPIPPGWYDGIPQGLAIIWSSVCTFYGDGTSSGWSDPALESDTANLDVEFSPRRDKPNPPYGNTPFSNHEAEGWYDPNSPNFNTAGEMIWRAERKVSNGVYDGPWVITSIVGEGGEQGPPGKTGGHHEYRYKNHQVTSANPVPVKPATGTDGTQNGWSITLPSLSSQDLLNDIVTFMTQCFVNEDGEYGEWTLPMRITGANGKDGEDGDEIEFIYTRMTTVWENPQAPFSPQIDDWTGSYGGKVWTDHPEGVTKDIPLEYVCQRNKIDGTWYPYSTPVVWSRWGRNGMDGDGCEYVFVRSDNDMPPTITNSNDTYDGKTYLDDDYCPLSSAGRCTDNPSGVTRSLRYEWAITRKMTEPTDLGVRLWTKYSGTMSLWAKFTESTIRVDLDNENDSMLYSSSKGLVSGYVNSTATLFDGQKDVSGSAAWAILSASGCTARLNNRTITVTEMSTTSGYVVIQADYNGLTYTATLTLKKIIDGDKYDLIIKPSSISYNNTTDTPASTTITIEIWRTSVDGTRMKVAPPLGTDGYSTYVLDGTTHLTSSNAASFTYDCDNSARGDITVKIAKGWDSNDYLDCETIPICKATDGQSAFKSTMFVRMNDTPVKPANNKGSFSDPNPSGCIAGTNSSGTLVKWSDGIPEGENILWATSRIFTSNGLAPLESSWSTPRLMTDTATYDVEFAKRQANDGVPPNPTDANRHGGSSTLVWFDPTLDSSEDFRHMYWRAEREKKNGEWGNWIVNRINGEKGQSSFKSTMFVRMNNTPTKPANNKGSFSDPNPSNCVAGQNSDGVSVSWEDGIPAGENILWATSRTFSSDGYDPQDLEWSTPRQMTDTSTYDVEFAKKLANNAEPPAPTDANRHGGSGPQIWFDPTNDPSEDFKQMYWRAEREKKNGVWGDWVINNIKGEKGDFVNAYQISSNIGTVHFRSGETLKDVTFIFNSYKLTGENPLVAEDTETVPCYYAIYSRTGNTYSRLDYSTSLYAFWHPTILNVSVNYDELLVVNSPNALSSSNYSSNFPTSYYTYLSIHIVKDGVDGFIVDLTNEMDGIPCTNDLRIILDTDMYSLILAFFGTNDVTSECKIKISHQVGYVDGIYLESSNSGTGNTAITTSFQTIGSNKWIRLNFSRVATITGGKREVEFEIKHDLYGLAVVRIIVLAMKGGAIYNLVPSNNIIRKSSSTYSPSTITCSVSKLDINSGQSSTNPTEATIKYTKDDTSTEYTYSGALTAGSTFTKSVKFLLYVGGNVVDEETVRIVSDGADGIGSQGALGSYEIKLYARSAYATSNSGSSMPADCSDNNWTTVPPIPKTSKPYIWQRSRMYNPATDTYTDWVYVRLTGEIGTPGSPGLTGLWYNYAGVWGLDISSVKNTDRIGYYVQTSGGDFYMNTAPSGQTNNNAPGGANWVKMQSDFKYIITEAIFGDYAQLGSFIINGDWFISKEGKLGGSWSNLYTSFSPSGFPNSGFIPNVAIDAKTGKAYFNDAHVEGYISATSGRIGNWTINNYGTGGISAEGDSLPYIYLRLRNTSRMAVIGNYDDSNHTMILGSYPGGHSIWAKGLGTSSSRGVGLYANAIYPSSGEKGSDAIYAIALGSDCTAVSAYGLLGAKALEVSGGDTVIGGSGLFSVGCAVKTTSFTLPSSPKTGTIFLCKGSNLTVTTSNHKVTEGSDGSVLIASGGSSHNFSSTTFMLFFDGSEWALLYSA